MWITYIDYTCVTYDVFMIDILHICVCMHYPPHLTLSWPVLGPPHLTSRPGSALGSLAKQQKGTEIAPHLDDAVGQRLKLEALPRRVAPAMQLFALETSQLSRAEASALRGPSKEGLHTLTVALSLTTRP